MGSKKKHFRPSPIIKAESNNAVQDLVEVKPQDNERKKPPLHPLDRVLTTFLADIQSVLRTHQVVMPHLYRWLKDQHEKNSQTLEKFQTEIDEDGKEFYKAESAHQAAELLKAIRDIDGLRGLRIPETLQRSLFTQLFSEFDAFIGALLKVIYTNKEDLLKSIAKEVTFSELLKYEDLNAVKVDMLDKEIESFRRESYVEQFSILENKFSMKTLKAFPEWGEFVELSQRRNIVVHNGGKVSEQYLTVCDREGHSFLKRPDMGEVLAIDVPYFARAVIVLSKVAFMLSHTLWRKVFPDQVQVAHDCANMTVYNLLKDKRWKTGLEISRFCLCEQMKKDAEDLTWRVRVVNAAIAAKFSDNNDEAQKYLQSVDWTASYRDFKLARAVLTDDFEEAEKVMKAIGKNGELIDELSYHEWPLFHKFRESPEFLNAYQEIYGTSFVKEAVRKSAASAAGDEAKAEATEATTVDLQPSAVIVGGVQ
ncbi:MAG: hypothetical protein Q8R72_00720 [Hylemonella sp.]|nr:hypothetical protein [Hylemonella sp.]